MDPKLEISNDFISRLAIPSQKPRVPFLVGMIGLTGSGRTTVARMLAENIPGSILISANSVRFLLSERNMPWGQNVREVLRDAGTKLLNDGYGLIFDGNAAQEEDRDNIAKIAKPSGAKVFYIRISIDIERAKQREIEKYNNPEWVSSFQEFRVNTTEKMIANIEAQRERDLHVDRTNIPDLMGTIDNSGSLENLKGQVDKIVEKIQNLI